MYSNSVARSGGQMEPGSKIHDRLENILLPRITRISKTQHKIFTECNKKTNDPFCPTYHMYESSDGGFQL